MPVECCTPGVFISLPPACCCRRLPLHAMVREDGLIQLKWWSLGVARELRRPAVGVGGEAGGAGQGGLGAGVLPSQSREVVRLPAGNQVQALAVARRERC